SLPFPHLFLALFPPFPCPFPAFSLPFSRLFPALTPPFPAAKPRLDASGCPPLQNWTEGQEGNLTCRARGHPEPRPRVSCSKAGNSRDSLDPGVPQPARLGHAGTYLCRATNELGTAESNVTLRVQRESGGPAGCWG
ncbi:ICAM1 protein, partial [Nicator chloris]|nr:ICAM1 protein [Nicator chloris]